MAKKQEAGAVAYELCLPCPVMTVGRGDLCREVVGEPVVIIKLKSR